jgi:hypothetical protein
MQHLKKLLIALTPIGAAALLLGGGTFASFAELDAWTRERRLRPAATTAKNTGGGGMPSIVKTKKVLLAVMAIGAAAYLGTGGTFATFSAETSNNGSSIASGTLTMDNQVGSNPTLCLSANGAVNVNPNCDKVVNVTNVAPGVYSTTQTAQVTIRNTGSIDATNFYLSAPYANSTLTTKVSTGFTSGTIAIAGLEGSVAIGNTIRLSYGGQVQDFTASAAASGGATSLTISGTATTADFPVGTIVTNQSSNATPANTDCYDKLTTGSGGATGGTDLTGFVSTTNNPFCQSVLMWVQETTGGPSGNKHYCWFGYGAGSAACTAPLSGVTLTTAATCNSTSLTFSALNGNIKPGDTIAVTTGSTTCTFTAAAGAAGTAYVGATTVTVTPVTGGGTTLPIGSTVVNKKALSDLDSTSGNTNTVSNFDTLYGGVNHIQLYPVASDGSVTSTAGLVRLAHYNSGTYARTFQIGFYLPSPTGGNQNTLQGLASTFGMTWHIEQ